MIFESSLKIVICLYLPQSILMTDIKQKKERELVLPQVQTHIFQGNDFEL